MRSESRGFRDDRVQNTRARRVDVRLGPFRRHRYPPSRKTFRAYKTISRAVAEFDTRTSDFYGITADTLPTTPSEYDKTFMCRYTRTLYRYRWWTLNLFTVQITFACIMSVNIYICVYIIYLLRRSWLTFITLLYSVCFRDKTASLGPNGRGDKKLSWFQFSRSK